MPLRFHWLETAVIALIMTLSITTGFSATAPVGNWTNHVDIPSLYAIAGYLAKIIVATITAMGGIIWLLVKQIWKQDRQAQTAQIEKLLLSQETLIKNQTIQRNSLIQMHQDTSKKFDRVIGAMGECKTCTAAIKAYDHKQEQRLILDSEDDHWTVDNMPEMVAGGENR